MTQAERESHGDGGGARADAGEMSTFLLDVYWAEKPGGDPAVALHVAGCARCQAYLANLDALEARGPGLPRVSMTRHRPTQGLGRLQRLWALPVAGALAAAAAVALFVHGRHVESDRYVGIKGTPAVQVLLHRGNDTRIWDGHSPLHPGDALALRVACEGLRRVVVAAPGPGGWSRLSEAACPAADDAPLPFTLQVDNEPGEEKLAVVLALDAMDDDALQRVIAEERRAPDVWVVRYVMQKEMETDR